ncbi:MAG: hypothetical protein JL56_07460 [Desulfotomaculum sp. BICA1-6]|nr:MAG: hypothetical protein JL56_07460 [Desulfotomaculum sp. BICA1-6]
MRKFLRSMSVRDICYDYLLKKSKWAHYKDEIIKELRPIYPEKFEETPSRKDPAKSLFKNLSTDSRFVFHKGYFGLREWEKPLND